MFSSLLHMQIAASKRNNSTIVAMSSCFSVPRRSSATFWLTESGRKINGRGRVSGSTDKRARSATTEASSPSHSPPLLPSNPPPTPLTASPLSPHPCGPSLTIRLQHPFPPTHPHPVKTTTSSAAWACSGSVSPSSWSRHTLYDCSIFG